MARASQHRILRVGLTGGIASGKTTVARLFAALGVPVIDADEISRELVRRGAPLLQQVGARFGAGVIGPQGELDRRALRNLVFSDAAARKDLEALMHPAILATMAQRSAQAGGRYQLLVIPLLVEQHHRDLVQRVLVVDCEEAAQLLRVQVRDGVTQQQARAVLSAQAPRAARLAAADDVLTNDGDVEHLRDQVQRLHGHYLALSAAAPG